MNYDLCSGTCLKKSGIYSVAMFHMNEGRLLEQIFWTVPKVGPCFILKAVLFKEFAETSCS